ncbi:monocarboxylate transporter 12-like [Corticium candelabrum]|uniref:monocarboxylate transporter 12-like n=1 Tax=Corticium candelabrum TaxID=121492 RepID=UPI002E259BB5|nr:monocarboxylate transporter 12-like [Corticium candelabrum]
MSAAGSTVTVGLIADHLTIQHKILLLQLLLLLGGISTMLLPFYHTFALVAVYMAAYGVAMGFTTLISVITVAIVGEEQSMLAIGMITLYASSSIIGPPIAGWMYDSSGNYNDGFLVFGLVLVIAALLLSLYKVVRRIQLISTKQGKSTLSVIQRLEKNNYLDATTIVIFKETSV